MSQMEKPPENTPKRPVGRPRGSKNKPDAGTRGKPVGRPRKNQPASTASARTGQATSSTGTQTEGECLASVMRALADHRLRGSRTPSDRGIQPSQSGSCRWYVLDPSNNLLMSTFGQRQLLPPAAVGNPSLHDDSQQARKPALYYAYKATRRRRRRQYSGMSTHQNMPA